MPEEPSSFGPQGSFAGGSDPNRRRPTLLPAWLAVTFLVVLLGFVLIRNFLHDQRPRAQSSSDLIQKERTAVAETKTAFSMVYAHKRLRASTVSTVETAKPIAAPKPIVPPVQEAVTGQNASPGASPRPGRSPFKRAAAIAKATDYGQVFADVAIEDWQAITSAKTSRPGAWRRLGITLFLFNRPGGMAAFRRIPRLPPPAPVPVAKSALPRRIKERIAVPEVSTLPVAEEMALWETLYGPVGPKPAEVPALRANLTRLRLGWFEDIAAAQLYDRAGLPVEADSARRQALNSANNITALLTFETRLRLLGLLLLIGYSVVWLGRLIMRAQDRTIATDSAGHTQAWDLPIAPGMAGGQIADAPGPSPVLSDTPSPFSFRTRTIAFVAYFASFLAMAWPMQALGPLIAKMSDLMALRFTVGLELAAYVPVIALTLFVFKRFAESEQHRRFTWRETLAAAGVRSDGLGKDTVTAVVSYLMTMPLLILAATASAVLFKNFHTPVHPLDLIIVNTQDGVTRALLLIQATIGAPIVEELMFRGVLFSGLRERWGLWISAALSAAVFALAHNTLPGGFLQLWTLGFVFALVCHRNRSIVPSVLMHAMHNALVTLVMFAVFSQ